MHLLLTIYRAKAYMMEKARNNSDPESPQNGAASLHYKDSSVTFPVRREWSFQLGKKKEPGQASSDAWHRSMGSIKQGITAGVDSLLQREPTSFNINDRQGFVLGTDVPGTTKTAPGSCKVYKKITLKTVQIGIIYRELKKGIQE